MASFSSYPRGFFLFNPNKQQNPHTFTCMSENPSKLFLLDAMALIYRAHFALSKNPRINSSGINTGAVMGFTNTLLEIINKEKPSHKKPKTHEPGRLGETNLKLGGLS